ncbi:MAG TPA: glycosyltransferase family 39 protein [Baekduia sp.]|nr:glycosyltransferase family 39 protein [Baekduia sp.]
MDRIKTFEGRLATIALGGLLIRLLYTALNRSYPVIGDALTFHMDAAHLADGEGFRRAYENMATAEHPPLHIVVLAVVDVLGGHGTLAQKFVLCFIGTGTVVAIGFLARRIAGPRAGLIAAFIGAVYPLLWVIDGALMSETEYVLIITLVLILAYRHLDAPSPRRALALGAMIALATLTRGEAIGLIVLLALPIACRTGATWRARLGTAALIVGAFCAVMAPWSVRNLLTFKEPILISTNGYGVVIGANCNGSYYGDLIGSWDYHCFTNRLEGDESQYSVDYRDRGLRYARDHAGRIPKVVAIRLLRQFDFYRPAQSVIFQASEGRYHTVAWWGLRVYWLLLPFGVAGAVLLWRRRQEVLILAAPVALAVLIGILVYGSTRLRVAMEPVLVVLAAVAMDALVARVRERGRQSSSADAASSAPASATPTSVSAGISQSQSIEAWKA